MKKRIINLLPYIVVVLLITGIWFVKSGYLFFVDMAWGPQTIVEWQNSWFFLQLIFKASSYIIPAAVVEKIFISLVFLVVLLGGRKIAMNFINNKWLVFILSLFVLFNPFIYDRVGYGQFGLILAFGWLCLTFGYFLEYLQKRQPRQLILAGLFAAFIFHVSMHLVFLYLMLYILFLVLCIFQRKKIKWASYIKYTLLMFAIIIVLNINWLLPAFIGSSNLVEFISVKIGERDLEIFQVSGGSSGEAFKNVLMMSGFWGKDQFRYADLTKINTSWGRSFYFLTPLFIWGLIIGLYKKKRRKLTIGLLIAFIIATVLALGIRMPIGRNLTLWLFENVSFYKGMRETHKWTAILVIVYFIFLIFGTKELFKRRIVAGNKFIFKILLTTVIVLYTPALLFGFGKQILPTHYPDDWHEMEQFIVEDGNCEGKILFLPWHLYMSFNWVGRVVANPANRFFSCPVIQGTNIEMKNVYDNTVNPDNKLVKEWIFTHGGPLLAENSLNIQYVIVAKEVDWQNYIWIDKSSRLDLIRSTHHLLLYKVK